MTDPSVEHPDDSSDRLAELGAERPAERMAKRVVPWIASLTIHIIIVLLAFLLTWTVVRLGDEGDPAIIVAELDIIAHEPVEVFDLEEVEIPAEPVEIELPPLDVPLDALAGDLDLEALDLLPEALLAPAPADFLPPPPPAGAASFMGIEEPNANRIVYVIDASGTMIAYLQIVLQELARSLDGLTPDQSFGIVFFQRSEALVVPPPRRLVPATAEERARALRWIDQHVIPAGRSNPIAAFEAAMQYRPEVIFLLSDNITGSGIFEIDQEELLAKLDELNPVERLTGRRRTIINCIQFLDPDPLDTLRRIAELHGSPRGYKYLSRRELGLSVR